MKIIWKMNVLWQKYKSKGEIIIKFYKKNRKKMFVVIALIMVLQTVLPSTKVVADTLLSWAPNEWVKEERDPFGGLKEKAKSTSDAGKNEKISSDDKKEESRNSSRDSDRLTRDLPKTKDNPKENESRPSRDIPKETIKDRDRDKESTPSRPSRDIPKETIKDKDRESRPSRDIPKETIKDRPSSPSDWVNDEKEILNPSSPSDWVNDEKEILNPSSPHDWVIEEGLDSWSPQDWVNEEKNVVDDIPYEEELLPEELIPEILMKEPGDLGDIFTKVRIILDGKEIDGGTVEVKNGSCFQVEYHWEVGNSQEIVDGDFATIQLPKAMDLNKTLGGKEFEVKMGDTVVGHFTVDRSNVLRVVFNKKMEGIDNKKGKFEFKYEIFKSDFENDRLKEIQITTPEKKDFTIKFIDNKNGSAITKIGSATPSTNPQYVNWEIDVNTKLDELKNLVIEDNLPEGLALENPADIRVYALTVGADDKLTKGKLIRTDNNFPINMGNRNKAYRVEFRTKITDRRIKEFVNTASIKADGVNESADAKVENKRTIDLIKSGSVIDNNKKIRWTVKVNNEKAQYEDLKLIDTIGEGQKLIPGSITIEENGSNVGLGEYKITEKDNKIEINFGKTESNFVVNYETEVSFTDKDKVGTVIERKNKAMTQDGDRKLEEKDANVWVYRQKLIQKWPLMPVINIENGVYNKFIPWTITINEGKENLGKGLVIRDTLPEGTELDLRSIVINDIVDGNRQLVQGKDYTVSEDKKALVITFLIDVDRSYRIDYRTNIIDFNKDLYFNHATMEQNGVEIDEANSSLPGNSLNTLVNKSYTAIDYDNKTVDWEITIKSNKGKFTKLGLGDYMSNNHDLVQGSIKVYMDGVELKKNVDYAEIDDTTSRDRFLLTILEPGLAKSKGDSQLKVIYKSTFKILEGEPETTIDRLLKNKVKVELKTEKGEDENLTAEKFVPLEGWVAENGSKYGVLDKDRKRIHWIAYLNPLANDYSEIELEDSLSEGQEFDPESFNVYRYEFSGKTPKLGELIPEFSNEAGSRVRNYTLKMKEDKLGFDLTMNKLYGPIALKYDSVLTGIAKEYYENKIIVDNDEYDSTVRDDNFDHFVEKTGNIEDNTVYKGDVIEWAVKLNDSKSDIIEAEFVDVISPGQKFLEKTLKIRDSQGRDIPIDPSNIVLLDVANGGSTLTIKLGDISDVRIISYSTVVTSETGTISNDAKLSGKGFLGFEHNVGGITVKDSASGTVTGSEGRGSITIRKVDESKELIITDSAEFKLSQVIAGEEIERDEIFKTSNGILKIEGLKYGDYILREVKAPAGYEISRGELRFTISKDEGKKDITEDFINRKVGKILMLYKVDANDEKVKLEGAKFEIKNENGIRMADILITDSNGIARLINPRLGNYIITEIEAPKGYKLDRTPYKISIIESQDQYTIKIKNKKDIGEPEKPVEPGEPEKPVEPGEPEKPVEPGEPEKPVEPGEPEKPVEPGEPEKPVEPGEPEKPVEPGEPGKPVRPNKPHKPSKPSKPSKPKDPKDPEKPIVSIDPKDPSELIESKDKEELKEDSKEVVDSAERERKEKEAKEKKAKEKENQSRVDSALRQGKGKGQVGKGGVLPKTGEKPKYGLYALGLGFIVLGFIISKDKKRYKKK